MQKAAQTNGLRTDAQWVSCTGNGNGAGLLPRGMNQILAMNHQVVPVVSNAVTTSTIARMPQIRPAIPECWPGEPLSGGDNATLIAISIANALRANSGALTLQMSSEKATPNALPQPENTSRPSGQERERE